MVQQVVLRDTLDKQLEEKKKKKIMWQILFQLDILKLENKQI